MIPWSDHNFMMKAISKLFLAKTRENVFKMKKNKKIYEKMRKEAMMKESFSKKEVKISKNDYIIKISPIQSVFIFFIN